SGVFREYRMVVPGEPPSRYGPFYAFTMWIINSVKSVLGGEEDEGEDGEDESSQEEGENA
ncbi:MAG: hypothetical protein SXQ77_02100, partial [Halobacteria archaeon]|nr:hypothetical protein [Halobacteria archaeon]